MFEVWDSGLGMIWRRGARHKRTGPVDVFCAPGYKLLNGKCVPEKCAAGMVLDPKRGYCVPVDNCPGGMLDKLTGRCLLYPVDPVWPDCPAGAWRDNSGQCVGTSVPVVPTQSTISPEYIAKYTAKFGRRPLMPGDYTGKFVMPEWTGSPGGPGLPDLSGGGLSDAPPDPWSTVDHASRLATLILSVVAVGALVIPMLPKKGKR